MRILYWDCTSGVSGDMLLGAHLDLGVDPKLLVDALDQMGLQGYRLLVNKKNHQGIPMTDVDVQIEQEPEGSCFGNYELNSRNYLDIRHMIENSSLPKAVKEKSLQVFGEIARAESQVHRVPLEKVTFHEKGALDSIVDIVGVAFCIDALQVDRICISPLHDGYGFMPYRYGMLPVPVPAVKAMLEGTGIPVVKENISTELVTPTGMGLVKCFGASFGDVPPLKVIQTGYGSGKRQTGLLGAVRVLLGDLETIEN